MSIKSLIIDILNPLGVPVDFEIYDGEETTYITFSEYLEQGEVFSDNEEIVTGHYIQIDVWSKGSLSKLVDQVKALLKKAGFIRKTEHEMYETNTQVFHRAIRFFYEENKEDE